MDKATVAFSAGREERTSSHWASSFVDIHPEYSFPSIYPLLEKFHSTLRVAIQQYKKNTGRNVPSVMSKLQ